MIARFEVAVPFAMVVPDNTEFRLYRFEVEGYSITFRPPVRTPTPIVGTQPESVTIDEKPAFIANGLVIDFQREEFDRRAAAPMDVTNVTVDPPSRIIVEAINFLLARIRYVSRGFMIHEVNALTGLPWTLRYLNDDESELQPQQELVRARFAMTFAFSSVSIHPALWDGVFALNEFDIPVWDALRLDALNALPHVGTAVVLAFTALETFIARILNDVAAHSGVSSTLWQWINKRPNFLAEPSTEEQFDQLLREFVGHSLKENGDLWTAFQHLRKARNTFIHEGTAVVGGQPVDEARARLFIKQVDEIIAQVRLWMPTPLQWPTFDFSGIKVVMTHPIPSMGTGASPNPMPTPQPKVPE